MNKELDLDCGRPELNFRENARLILPAVIEEFYVCDPQSSDDPEVLHQLRIAAKRLRYSLEFFEICYGNRLTRALESIRDLQELLGGIHDCDMMVELLIARREKLKSRENAEPILNGLEELIDDFQKERLRLAGEFFALWKRRFSKRFKSGFLKTIDKPNLRMRANS